MLGFTRSRASLLGKWSAEQFQSQRDQLETQLFGDGPHDLLVLSALKFDNVSRLDINEVMVLSVVIRLIPCPATAEVSPMQDALFFK
jgi:hypothetical protein